MAESKSSKTELVAIYRLEFYRKQKNWKLCSDKRRRNACKTTVVKPTLNETYNVKDPSPILDDKEKLNDAFLETCDDKNIFSPLDNKAEIVSSGPNKQPVDIKRRPQSYRRSFKKENTNVINRTQVVESSSKPITKTIKSYPILDRKLRDQCVDDTEVKKPDQNWSDQIHDTEPDQIWSNSTENRHNQSLTREWPKTQNWLETNKISVDHNWSNVQKRQQDWHSPAKGFVYHDADRKWSDHPSIDKCYSQKGNVWMNSESMPQIYLQEGPAHRPAMIAAIDVQVCGVSPTPRLSSYPDVDLFDYTAIEEAAPGELELVCVGEELVQPWTGDQLLQQWSLEKSEGKDINLSSSLAEFMRGAHAAPHSSEVDLRNVPETEEIEVASMSGRELAAGVRRHARALRCLLSEARGRRGLNRTSISLNNCSKVVTRDFSSYEEFPTRDYNPVTSLNTQFQDLTPFDSASSPNKSASESNTELCQLRRENTFSISRDIVLAGSPDIGTFQVPTRGRGRGRLRDVLPAKSASKFVIF